MRRTNKKQINIKLIIIAILAILLITFAVGQTIAWLTKTSEVVNTFTVGSIKVPSTHPTNPGASITLNGNIYEPSWDEGVEHKIVPGGTFAKDPYIGIGAGSEAVVIYVYVENNFSNTNKIHFTLNEGWEAVAGNTQEGSEIGTYKSGLFKYTNVLECQTDTDGETKLDTWTTKPVFSELVVDDTITEEELKVADGKQMSITVKAFLHQAKDLNGTAIPDATILTAAKTTFGI